MATVALRGKIRMARRPKGTARNPIKGTIKQFVKLPMSDT
jgi:hypothetical protein